MSLLLDALKKAAEEKLANKDDDATAVDVTAVADANDVTVVDPQTQYDADTEYHDDATVVDHAGMPTEHTVADNSDADLTSFDFESVDEGTKAFSDTEVGVTKSHKEPTELESMTDLSIQYKTKHEDIESENTVIGKQDDHAIDLDKTGIDVTGFQQHQYEEPEQAQQKTSLTDNFLKKGYDISPEAAGKFIDASKGESSSKMRVFLLLGLVLLLGLGILSLFAYQYYADSRDIDYKLSYQKYKTKRNLRSSDGDQVESINSSIKDTTDEIIVKQEDYVNLLDKEFNAIADKSKSSKQLSQLDQQLQKSSEKNITRLLSNKVKQKASSVRNIEIKKVKRQPIADIVMQGYQAFNDGDIVAAKKHYQQAVNRKENSRDAKLGLAAIAITENNSVKARALYIDLLKENPSDPAALAGLTALGPVSLDTSKQNTLSSIKLMLEQQPNAAELHFALGNLYADVARWPEAQKAFFKAYSLDSDNPDYLYNLAVSLDYMGKQSKALIFYQQALVQSGLRQNNIPVVATEQRIKAIQ